MRQSVMDFIGWLGSLFVSAGEAILGLGVLAAILTLTVNVVRDFRARARERRVALVEKFTSSLLNVAIHRRAGGSQEDLDRLSSDLMFRTEMLVGEGVRKRGDRLEQYVRRVSERIRFGDHDGDLSVLVSEVAPALLGWAGKGALRRWWCSSALNRWASRSDRKA